MFIFQKLKRIYFFHSNFFFKYFGNYTDVQTGGLKKKYGFTLVEIMIAIFIFSIVITTVFGSYNFLFSSSEKINDNILLSEMGSCCLSRMIDDFESIQVFLPPEYYFDDSDEKSDPYRIEGKNNVFDSKAFSRIRFASLAHISFGKNVQEGIAEIIYYIKPSYEGDSYELKRSDRLYPFKPFKEENTDPVLCENIKSFKLKYYDKDGDEYDLWDSESDNFGYATPAEISIKLGLEKNSNPMLFETRVKLHINRAKKE